MIDLNNQNKLDINNMLNYPGESDTCSKVKSLDQQKINVDDEVEDDTISLEPLCVRKHLSHLQFFRI